MPMVSATIKPRFARLIGRALRPWFARKLRSRAASLRIRESLAEIVGPRCEHRAMDVSAVLVAVLMLAAGVVIGVLIGRARAAESARMAREEAARLDATLTAERAATREREAAQARAEARLREAFGALAGEALNRNNEAFAELAAAKLATAKASADGELAQRQQAIEALVGPLRESLERVQHQLNTVEKERAGSYAQLLSQIGTMRQTSE